MVAQEEREWRCHDCGTLLGVHRDEYVVLRYKGAQYIVTGSVIAVCRRCGALGTTVSTPQPAAEAQAPAATS